MSIFLNKLSKLVDINTLFCMKKPMIFILLFASISAFGQLGGITLPSGHSAYIYDLKLDASGRYLFSSETTKIIMWDVKTGTQLYTFPANSSDLTDYAISPNGNQLVIVTKQHTISYNTLNGKMLWKTRDLNYLETIIFSNDGVALLGVRSLG